MAKLRTIKPARSSRAPPTHRRKRPAEDWVRCPACLLPVRGDALIWPSKPGPRLGTLSFHVSSQASIHKGRVPCLHVGSKIPAARISQAAASAGDLIGDIAAGGNLITNVAARAQAHSACGALLKYSLYVPPADTARHPYESEVAQTLGKLSMRPARGLSEAALFLRIFCIIFG